MWKVYQRIWLSFSIKISVRPSGSPDLGFGILWRTGDHRLKNMIDFFVSLIVIIYRCHIMFYSIQEYPTFTLAIRVLLSSNNIVFNVFVFRFFNASVPVIIECYIICLYLVVVLLSNSCECDVSRTPGGIFFRFGANGFKAEMIGVRVWLSKVKVTLNSWRPIFVNKISKECL